MASYTLKRLDDHLWKEVQEFVEEDGRTMKATILKLLKLYVRVGMPALEKAAYSLPPRDIFIRDRAS